MSNFRLKAISFISFPIKHQTAPLNHSPQNRISNRGGKAIIFHTFLSYQAMFILQFSAKTTFFKMAVMSG